MSQLVATTFSAAAVLVLPSLVQFSIPYSPRAVLYSPHTLLPLLFHPFSRAPTILAALGRLLQFFLTVKFALPIHLIYPLQILIAAARCLPAFIFTRSVGWAYPAWFSHASLYEAISGGLGPGLVAYLALFSISFGVQYDKFTFPVIAFLLCWTDNLPWTYVVAMICAGIIGVGRWVIILRTNKYTLPSLNTIPTKANPTPKQLLIGLAPAVLLSILIPSFLFPAFVPYHPTPIVPTSASLHILILTFPRPSSSSLEILSHTVSSYTPFLTPQTQMTVFTHSSAHPSFSTLASNNTNPHVTFHTASPSPDKELDYTNGHYLHLSEAFSYLQNKAEWILLLEDDFPLCESPNSSPFTSSRWRSTWEILLHILSQLENERLGTGKLRSGFIGTGGSGLLFHHSYLSLLEHVMLTYARKASFFPQNVLRRPPDLVVQDCLLGQTHSLCETPHRDPTMFVPSRLILDHIGGMYTTTRGKELNSDKWRCGWRHAFHGREEVEIVVV